MKFKNIVSFLFLVPLFACSNSYANVTFNEDLNYLNVDILKTARTSVNMQGGRAWAVVELYPEGKLGLFCGAKASQEYEGVSASAQIHALNLTGQQIWSSEVFKIPTVCGRLDNKCRTSDEEEYYTKIPMSVVKDLANLKISISERK